MSIPKVSSQTTPTPATTPPLNTEHHAATAKQKSTTPAKAAPPAPADQFAQAPNTDARNKVVGHVVSQEGQAVPAKADPKLLEEASLARNHAHAHGHTHSAHGKGGGTKTADLGKGKFAYNTATGNGGKLNPALPSNVRTKDQLPHQHAHFDKEIAKRFPGGVTFKPPLKNDAHGADVKWALLNTATQAGNQTDAVLNLNGTNHLATIDQGKKGEATTVTVHGPGDPEVPTASQFKDYAAAKAKLEKDFGVKVADKPKKFSKADLEKVHAGFSLLSTKEQEALQDVTLERHSTLPKGLAGYFKTSHKTDRKGKPTSKARLQLADKAFDSDANKFVGSGNKGSRLPPSVATIVHEAAHGVDSHEMRKTRHDHAQAKYDANQAAPASSKAGKMLTKKIRKEDKAAYKPFQTAVSDVNKKAAALAAAKPADVAQRTKDLDTAIATRDAEFAKLPAGTDAHAAAQDLVTKQDTHAGATKTLGQATVAKDQATSDKKSSRLAAFEKHVKDNDIKPITDYAASGKVDEFYAEALSLYKTDPDYLKNNSPDLHKFFEQNKHL